MNLPFKFSAENLNSVSKLEEKKEKKEIRKRSIDVLLSHIHI